MSRWRLRTPSRLHFGLLAWGPQSPRQFGGVGLMIDEPRLELTAEAAEAWQADGPLARRALDIAESVAGRLTHEGVRPIPARIQIERAPTEHTGLGVGTQLSLAVTRGILAVAGLPEPSIAQLASLTGRGQRSGIGLHGFVHGGLIVDGGHGALGAVPPLLARLSFPPEWGVLVIQPARVTGLHGLDELRAFADLPPIADRITDRLCRLVLLGLLPAVMDRDLESFGAALTELQQQVGKCFASAQGGIYARPELEAIVAELGDQGLHGVGQSSWGPTLYGFSGTSPEQREYIRERIRSRIGLQENGIFWTQASRSGCWLGQDEETRSC
jgi:beta-ribofuranosylaminobenzene 5'-phosphate synthase